MTKWLFELHNVAKTFDAERERVLCIDRLMIPANGLVAVVGATGSGKTTLFNLLGKLDEPDPYYNSKPPEIWVNPPAAFASRLGKRFDSTSRKHGRSHAQEFSKSVSYVFQESYLLESASVKLNLSIACRSARIAVDDEHLKKVCKLAQLDVDFSNEANGGASGQSGRISFSQRAGTLSGGQKGRLGFARALVREPFLILADEVTSALDPDTALEVISALKTWTGDGHSCLWITHDYRLALEADYIVALRKGKPVEPEAIPIAHFAGDEDKIKMLVRSAAPKLAVASGPLEAPQRKSDSGVADGLKLASAEMFMPRSEAAREHKTLRVPYFWRYRQGARTTLVFLLLLLASAAYITWAKVASHFKDELDDPRLRHVVVEGNPNMGPDEWPIREESLRTLDRSLAVLRKSRAAGAHAAFGRITGSTIIPFSFVGPNGKPDGRPESGRVLRLDIDEPVTNAIKVKMRSGEEKSLHDALLAYGASRLEDGTRPIIVLPEILSNLRDRNGTAFLCDPSKNKPLHCDPDKIAIKSKSWEIFTIVGEAQEQPRDRKALFDAIMSMDQHKEWMLQVDPEQVEGGRIPYYERIAVYFDTGSYRQTQEYLEKQSFVFDRGNLDKLVRLLDASLGINASLLLLIAVVLSVTLVSAVNIVRLYIQQNEKRLAVLAAHGAPGRLPLTNLVAQVAVAWMISVPFLAALLGLLFAATQSGLAGVDFLPDRPMLFEGVQVWAEAAMPAAATLIVLILATVLTFLSWQRRHGPLAHVLSKS
jgi:ABC-type lipoprotein export system ATPase subunit